MGAFVPPFSIHTKDNMKVRIIEAGWDGFTGQLGHVEFVDGVSADISQNEASMLAAIVRVEDAELGTNPSPSQAIIDAHHNSAHVDALPTSDAVPQPALPVFSEAQLMEAADKGGIKALRALVEPTGITGNSVAQIIGKVLQAQADRLAREQAAVVAEAAAPEASAEAAAE